MNRSERNGNIEVLRFVFCVSVVLFHGHFGFNGGYLAVEFFFMITGYFLAKKLGAEKVEHSEEKLLYTLNTSWKDIWHRIKNILPALLISSIIGTIINILGQNWSLVDLMGHVFLLPYDLLLWQCYGFLVPSATGIVWYLSAMIFALWLLYPIIRKKYDIYVKYIAPILTWVIVGFLLNTYGKLEVPNEYAFGFLNTGILRAIAMISFGTVIYEISERITKFNLSIAVKWTLTGIEMSLYILVIIYFYMWREAFAVADGLIVLLLGIALIITTSKKSMLYGKLNSKPCIFLGEISVFLFMNHFYWFENINIFTKIEAITEDEGKVLALLISFLTSLFVYKLTATIRRYIFKWKNILIEKS